MADPHDPSPEPPRDPGRDAASEEAPPPADDRRARVRWQRRHIEDLSGQDPLRGGIDD